MSTGLIFDLKKYAINDGPGIRLTVFFKGCNLSCKWCHNPESISPKVQKMYTASKCIGAVKCIDNCPNDALEFTEKGIVTNTDVCNLCGKCAEVCPTKAFTPVLWTCCACVAPVGASGLTRKRGRGEKSD